MFIILRARFPKGPSKRKGGQRAAIARNFEAIKPLFDADAGIKYNYSQYRVLTVDAVVPEDVYRAWIAAWPGVSIEASEPLERATALAYRGNIGGVQSTRDLVTFIKNFASPIFRA